MKTFKFSLVLRTRENTDVFITLDDNIYGIHSKRVNILYVHAGLWNKPAGTQRQSDVVSTSMRRDHVASTLIRRHFNVVCPLGPCFITTFTKLRRRSLDCTLDLIL